MPNSNNILICSGYALDLPKGNSVTAKRLETLFNNSGHKATAVHTTRPSSADHFIALNAIKSAEAIQHFNLQHPSGKIHTVLTGTDIHRGIHQHKELAEKIFNISNTLIVAHPECIHEIPARWHAKVKVIYPSVSIPDLPDIKPFTAPTFTCLGHLREVKNPHLMYTASLGIKEAHNAYSLGDSLESECAETATQNAQHHPNYKWVKNLDRATALAWMQQSLATLNTSFLEGGANSVVEAIHLNVPVIASNIDGNRGLLGSNYLGLFKSDNAEELKTLMHKCLTDDRFISTLKQQLEKRKSLFSNENELQSWLEVCTGS